MIFREPGLYLRVQQLPERAHLLPLQSLLLSHPVALARSTARHCLIRFLNILGIRVRSFLFRSRLRLVTQHNVNRKVVRSDVAQAPHSNQPKVVRMKNVIDRSPKAGITRVKRAEEAAAFAGLE